MLDEGNEDCFTAWNVVFSDAIEEGFNHVETTRASKLVDEGRVSGVVVIEAHVFVVDE